MPKKRKGTMDIREILRQLRKGQSDRAVAKAMGINRKTERKLYDMKDRRELE